jgi:hypothetical protein
MSTIINNPRSEPERTVLVEGGDGGAGWAVAIVILVAVIVVGGFWYARHRGATAPATGGTNINVTLPATTGGTAPSTQ